MKPYILQISMFTKQRNVSVHKRERERSTMMQLSHRVVCMLNSSCKRKRVEATEFPKQRTTWKIEKLGLISLTQTFHAAAQQSNNSYVLPTYQGDITMEKE